MMLFYPTITPEKKKKEGGDSRGRKPLPLAVHTPLTHITKVPQFCINHWTVSSRVPQG